jgi:hypothetical protein
VAIGTTHFAFRYLGLNGFPATIPAYQISDVVLFLPSDVIKLKHDWVVLPAVNALVLPQILEQKPGVSICNHTLP